MTHPLEDARTRLLVVDDESFNREILSVLLESAGYAVDQVDGGQEALDRLAANPETYDAILLDRMMPGLSGMDVLLRLKQDRRLRHVPVIMQTAIDGQEEIVDGIRNGVFYYLVKPIQRELLLSITQAAVQDHSQYRLLMSEVKKHTDALTLMNDARFRYRTPTEANLLAVMLASAVPEVPSLVLGLSELMMNAVEHGNLGISYQEKSDLIAKSAWSGEIERRLALPENRGKSVEVVFTRMPHMVAITIIDQGEGFDWRRYMEMDPSRVFETHGRGIALARKTGFTAIEYQERGNVVMGLVDLNHLSPSEPNLP
ncbi:MAG: response regulator [Rhodospirillales bacterium]|jgi:CheY-like chemotaxis protein|nr:response regulator [Rhodospirillales bacterium]